MKSSQDCERSKPRVCVENFEKYTGKNKDFRPEIWWLETPRYGILPKPSLMFDLFYIDVDYCQFAECGFQIPTRVFGSHNIARIQDSRCNPGSYQTILRGTQHMIPFRERQLPRWGAVHVNSSTKLTFTLPIKCW